MPKPPLQRLTGWITKSIAATSRVTAGSSLSKQRPLCGWSEALDHAEFTASAHPLHNRICAPHQEVDIDSSGSCSNAVHIT